MATDLPEARSSGASSYSCGQPAVASFSTARRRGACASAQGRISPLPSEQVTCTQEWRIKIKHAERRAGLRQDACVAQRQCACRPLGHARTLPGLARAVAAPFSSNFVQIRPLASAAPHQRGSSRTAATARGTLYLRAHRHGTDQSFATAAVRRSGIKSVAHRVCGAGRSTRCASVASTAFRCQQLCARPWCWDAQRLATHLSALLATDVDSQGAVAWEVGSVV